MVHRRTIQQGNFDSVLHPATPGQPAQLNIRLRVRLLARDPSVAGPTAHSMVLAEHLAPDMGAVRKGRVADGDRTLFRCRSWLTGEFNAFSIKFKKAVELAWNNQLILLPPDGSQPGEEISDAAYRDFIGAAQVAAHVRCGLEIALVPTGSASTPHAIIEVLRLENPSGGQFRSYQLRMTNEDADFSSSVDPKWGRTYHQITAAHEVGHWLGEDAAITDPARYFDHVEAEACAAEPGHAANNDCEYGRTPGKRMAMMGAGSLVTPYDAKPWLLRIRRHTGVLFGWDVVHRIHFNRGIIPVSPRQKQLSRASVGARA